MSDDIDIGEISEALNDKADRDLENLDSTGRSNHPVIKVVQQLPAQPVEGVLYLIPEE